jgi:hypothetical protein
MSYKQTSAIAQVPRIYFLKAHALFLIGEACKGLSINDLRIHREIASGAADKNLAASFFAELPPRLFDLTLDVPGTSFNKAFLPSRLEHLLAFSAIVVDILPWTKISWAFIMEVSRGVQVAGAACCVVTRTVARVEDLK